MPCLVEMPVLIQAQENYADQGVAVLGLNALDEQQNAQDFVEDLGINFPSIRDAEGALLATIPGVPPRALPSTIVVDADGNIAARIIGPVTEPMVTDILNNLLAES
jgi:thiol-disulfide isomerase/thioredoxin